HETSQADSHMRTARQSLAVSNTKVHAVPSALLRRRRQRNRVIRKGMQIVDDVGALAILLDAGKAHRGARNESLGIGDELIEVVKSPGAALGLHGGREIEPAASLTLFVADDPVQIWT